MSGRVRVEFAMVDMTTGEIKDKVSVEREVGKRVTFSSVAVNHRVLGTIMGNIKRVLEKEEV